MTGRFPSAMGEIVAAMGCSHIPRIVTAPHLESAETGEAIRQAYAEMKRRLHRARPDTLVIVSDDHMTNFFLDNFPAICIHTGEATKGWDWNSQFRDPRYTYPVDGELGRGFMARAVEGGFDPSQTQGAFLDHAFLVPLMFLLDRPMPLLPIYLNEVVEPFPLPSRCHGLGRLLAKVVGTVDRRVAVVGAGGLSHYPGTPKEGHIDVEADRRLLKLMEEGRGSTIAALDPAEIDAQGEDEVRNWLLPMGAAGDTPGEVLFYRPCPGFLTGIAMVDLMP